MGVLVQPPNANSGLEAPPGGHVSTERATVFAIGLQERNLTDAERAERAEAEAEVRLQPEHSHLARAWEIAK
jgi:hypothetical protein